MRITASSKYYTILLGYYSRGLDRGKVILNAVAGQEMLTKVPTREPMCAELVTAIPAGAEPTTPAAATLATVSETPSTSHSAKRGRGRLKMVESATKEPAKDRYENVDSIISRNIQTNAGWPQRRESGEFVCR